MGQITLQTPVVGQPNSTEGPKIASDFNTLQAVINGNLDGTNVTSAFAASAGVNGSSTVKGVSNIATTETTSSTTYTKMATPDQVQNLVLPANGLIAVWYQATWRESQAQTAQAALFINSNQLVGATNSGSGPALQATSISSGGPNLFAPISTYNSGLLSLAAGAGYTGDVTTGQAVSANQGGPCYIFAAAGTYTISVQFRITGGGGGSVTAVGRKLWAQAISFV